VTADPPGARLAAAYAARHPGFAPPELLLRLHDEGRCDPHHESHLQFGDLVWFDAGALHRHHPPDAQLPELVPFAHTTRGDLWCFYPGYRGHPVPVCFCPDEDEVAFLHAPDLEGFCFRAMLEELAGTRLTDRCDPRRTGELLREQVELLRPHLAPRRADLLAGLAARELRTDRNGYTATLDEDELAAILAADFGPGFEVEFCHFVEQ